MEKEKIKCGREEKFKQSGAWKEKGAVVCSLVLPC
jgi:hypothetical protein